jgi:hypothetical protein
MDFVLVLVAGKIETERPHQSLLVVVISFFCRSTTVEYFVRLPQFLPMMHHLPPSSVDPSRHYK